MQEIGKPSYTDWASSSSTVRLQPSEDRNTKDRNRKIKVGGGRQKGKTGKQRLHNKFDAGGHQSDSAYNESDPRFGGGDNATRSRKPGATATSCKELVCFGGGVCVEDAQMGAARCQCPLGTKGRFCEEGTHAFMWLTVLECQTIIPGRVLVLLWHIK